MTGSSRTLSAQGLSLHTVERNPDGAPPVLLLHGWLDHCRGFDWLCEALPESFRLVALDFRGHGLSAHLPPGASYHFTDHLADALFALNSLSLPTAHLVGHSLGGTISLLLAAARPDRVRSVTTIESLGPSGGEPSQAVGRLKRFAFAVEKPQLKRRYPGVEAAAARILEANSSLPEAAALHFARHGTRPADGGVEFTFDPALRRPSGVSLDEEQLLALFSAVECPVQVIHGDAGYSFDDAQMRARLERLRSRPPISVPGGHHVHLERPKEVAAHVERFIREVEAATARW